MTKLNVGPDTAGVRLDVFLSENEELTRSYAQKLISDGYVTVGGKSADKNLKLKAGDTVEIEYPPMKSCIAEAEDIPLDIVYEDENGIRVSIQFMGLNYYDIPNAEALNSLFAVSLFDYEERDIAYQLQSNTHQLILSCMDNYSLSDYVNHSMTYYAQQLDAYNHDDNYATTILSLMNEQYEDFHDDQREEPQSTYYPIYDYVTKMYLGKNLTPEMSQEEAKAVMDDFMEKLLFDVPEDYHIDTDHFYEYFEEYYQNEIQTGQVENV